MVAIFYNFCINTPSKRFVCLQNEQWNEQWQPVKKVTVKKECRSQRGYQQMLVLSNLRCPGHRKGEGGRSQMIGWGPKTEVAPSPRWRKKREEMLVIGRGSWQTDPKQITPGEEDKNISETYLRHEGPEFFKPI